MIASLLLLLVCMLLLRFIVKCKPSIDIDRVNRVFYLWYSPEGYNNRVYHKWKY